MGMRDLPDFGLELYFERWEFTARHHLTASDAETLTIRELLALEGLEAEDFADLRLGYVPVEGGAELRSAIAATYETVDPEEVLCFAGAEEALFWATQVVAGPGDHAIVGLPTYQALESVPIAAGAEVEGLPLWQGSGDDLRWTLEVDRLTAMLRPSTALVAVNFPGNPSGFVPERETFESLVRLCAERGVTLLVDEVYRGIELDPVRTLPAAVDRSPSAVSVGVMSKAYGLPGLRVGWVASHDRALLRRLAGAKHYTSICNAGPSEYLATVALRHGDAIRDRNRGIVAENVPLADAFFAEYADAFAWRPPDGGCVAYPRYRGADGVEEFCRRAVQDAGVLLLPASAYPSRLLDLPDDRFRIGLGRRGMAEALDALATAVRA